MVIKNDVHDIASRIKEVDSSYYMDFDPNKNKFALYGGKEVGLIMVLPYDRLDARTVEHVRKTRVERLDAIIAEIEADNVALEKMAKKEALAATEAQLYNIADRVIYEGNNTKTFRD